MASEQLAPLNIRLEGRVETLQRALERYGRIELQLKGDWRTDLASHRAELDTLAEHEPATQEAITHIEWLAGREGWAATHPAVALARQISVARKKVTRRSGMHRHHEWPAVLERLRRRAVPVRLPADEETVLLEGTVSNPAPLGLMLLGPTVLGIAASGYFVEALCPLALAVVARFLLRDRAIRLGDQTRLLGHYQLLPDRLVWLPKQGVPFDIPLDTIEPEGVSVGDGMQFSLTITYPHSVYVQGNERLHLPYVSSASELAALLELQRQGPLANAQADRERGVFVLPAGLSPGETRGAVLIHPRGLCFLDAHESQKLFRHLTHPKARLFASGLFVLEQLTRLPPERLLEVLDSWSRADGRWWRAFTEVSAVHESTPRALRFNVADKDDYVDFVVADATGINLDALREHCPWAMAHEV